jgi:hypothetical protein
MKECGRALVLDFLCINQSEKITSFDFGASSETLKGTPAQKQAAGDSICGLIRVDMFILMMEKVEEMQPSVLVWQQFHP